MTASVRINDLVIPELANTEKAIEFGLTLTDTQRRELLAAHKAMELASLNASHLQDRANFATTAQLWREAAEARS